MLQLAGFLVLLLPGLASQGGVAPAAFDPLDRVVVLDLAPEAPGKGTVRISHRVSFDGTLHVWSSELVASRLALETVEGELLEEAELGEPGEPPYLRYRVENGQELVCVVGGRARDPDARPRLHLVAAPDTEADRAWAEETDELLTAVADRDPAEWAAVGIEVERAMEALEELGASRSERVARVSAGLVGLARAIGDFSLMARALAKVVEIQRACLPPDHGRLQRARSALAAVYERLHRSEEAAELQGEVVASMERRLNPFDPELAEARLFLGNLLFSARDVPGAIRQQREAVAAYERNEEELALELARARLDLGVSLQDRGELDEAGVLFARALAVQHELLGEGHDDVVVARSNLAAVRFGQADYVGARALQEAVLDALPPESPRLPHEQKNLAMTLVQLDELEEALQLLESALASCQRLFSTHHANTIQVRLQLAGVLVLLGDPPRAKGIYESILSLFGPDPPGDVREVLHAKAGLGTIAIVEGRYSDAAELNEEVLFGFLDAGLPERHPDVCKARKALASALRGVGRLEEAQEQLESALAGLRSHFPTDHPAVLGAVYNLGNLRLERGEVEGAIELYEEASVGCARRFGRAHPELIKVRLTLAGALRLAGELERANELAHDVVDGSLDRLTWAQTSRSPREARAVASTEAARLASLAFLREAPTSASAPSYVELVETLRDVANLGLGEAIRNDPELVELRAEHAEIADRIAALGAAELRPDAAPELGELVERRDELLRRVRAALAERGRGPIRIADVARGLGPTRAAIGYIRTHRFRALEGAAELHIVTEDVVLAHAILADGSVVERDLGPAEELERLAGQWRDAVESGRGRSGSEPELAELGRELFDRLLEPLLARLGDEVETLVVFPTDFVHTLPLDALPAGDGLLGERLRVVFDVSMHQIARPRVPWGYAPDAELLAIGDVDFGERDGAGAGSVSDGDARVDPVEPLSGTRQEVETIGALFTGSFAREPRVLSGADATKAMLLEQLEGTTFLHLATHGWFEPLPRAPAREASWTVGDMASTVEAFAPLSRSGLALAGANLGRNEAGRLPGILTAEELAAADLSSCRLAVLSACETNVGMHRTGLGIQSLDSALRTAGVGTSITSLWKVSDGATSELMSRFYANLWKGRMGPAEALWAAKMAVRDERRPAADWAGWVLSGAHE